MWLLRPLRSISVKSSQWSMRRLQWTKKSHLNQAMRRYLVCTRLNKRKKKRRKLLHRSAASTSPIISISLKSMKRLVWAKTAWLWEPSQLGADPKTLWKLSNSTSFTRPMQTLKGLSLMKRSQIQPLAASGRSRRRFVEMMMCLLFAKTGGLVLVLKRRSG